MKKKVYVWIDQYYEDNVNVKTFENKQKALDYVYKIKLENIAQNCFDYYRDKAEMVRNNVLNHLEKQYKEGNVDYFDIWETEIE